MAYTIDLTGKVALVTGGASGIGYAIAVLKKVLKRQEQKLLLRLNLMKASKNAM